MVTNANRGNSGFALPQSVVHAGAIDSQSGAVGDGLQQITFCWQPRPGAGKPNQEHANDRPKQYVEGGPHVAYQILAQWLNECPEGGVSVGILLRETRGDRGKIGLRLGHR